MRSDAREPIHDGSRPGGDPQWDLAIDIAADLWLYGEYVVEVKPYPVQQVVDIHWAALQAGRVLGAQAKVQVGERSRTTDPLVTVSVTFVDPDGRGLERAQKGLDALLRSVHDAQVRKEVQVPARRSRG
jgi:hypothetical protein